MGGAGRIGDKSRCGERLPEEEPVFLLARTQCKTYWSKKSDERRKARKRRA